MEAFRYLKDLIPKDKEQVIIVKKKKLFLIALVLAATMMLAGCAKINMNVKVNKDLSGTVNFDFGMPDKLFKMIHMTPEELLEELADRGYFEAASFVGISVSTYRDNGYSGITLGARITDLSKRVANFSMLSKTDGTIRFEIPVETLFTGFELVEDELGNIMDGLNFKLTVQMPEKISDTNAGEVSEDGMTATWNVMKYVGGTVYAECEVGGLPDIVWILIAVATVLIVATMLIILVHDKKEEENPADESEQESLPEEETEEKETTEDIETTTED